MVALACDASQLLYSVCHAFCRCALVGCTRKVNGWLCKRHFGADGLGCGGRGLRAAVVFILLMCPSSLAGVRLPLLQLLVLPGHDMVPMCQVCALLAAPGLHTSLLLHPGEPLMPSICQVCALLAAPWKHTRDTCIQMTPYKIMV